MSVLSASELQNRPDSINPGFETNQTNEYLSTRKVSVHSLPSAWLVFCQCGKESLAILIRTFRPAPASVSQKGPSAGISLAMQKVGPFPPSSVRNPPMRFGCWLCILFSFSVVCRCNFLPRFFMSKICVPRVSCMGTTLHPVNNCVATRHHAIGPPWQVKERMREQLAATAQADTVLKVHPKSPAGVVRRYLSAIAVAGVQQLGGKLKPSIHKFYSFSKALRLLRVHR